MMQHNNLFKLIFIFAMGAISISFTVFAQDSLRGIGGTGNIVEQQGIGGTGHSESRGGIGGTGSPASRSGIGGTGRSQDGIGGTGIVGTITGFGSIWVNGVEVQYDAKTLVADNTATANTDNLAIGQVVAIEASDAASEVKASKISVMNAVEGPISAVDELAHTLTVLGQTVQLDPRTIMQDSRKNPAATSSFKPGDYVKISGLRLASGAIVASRIEQVAEFNRASVVGPITAISGKHVEIYGLQLVVTADKVFKVGQEISVAGKMSQGVFTAKEITPSPTLQLLGRAGHINLQGYVGEVSANGQLKVGGLEVEVPASLSTAKSINPGELIEVSGRLTSDNRIIVERIEFSRDRMDRMMYNQSGRQDRGATDKVERSEKNERSEKMDRAEKAERSERSDRADRPDKPDRSDHSDRKKH